MSVPPVPRRRVPPDPVRLPFRRRAALAVAGRPWTVLVLVGIVAFAFWARSTRTQPHHVKAAFPSAVSLVPGLDVQVHGIDVGKISSVDYEDGEAIVGLGIKDERFWPLHRGTTATIRYGTTAGNGTRRVDLVPGPASAPALGEGGIISAQYTQAPVDFDEIFRMMNRETRTHMRSLVGRTAETLQGRAGELNAGLRTMAPAVENAGGLLGDLASNEDDLNGLITMTHRATSTLAARQGTLADLITVASQTFAEFAHNTRAIDASLEQAPTALRDARGTLARLDGSVDHLQALVRDAAPGAAQLPALAADARPAVAGLGRTAPALTSVLRTGTRAAPSVSAMLDRGVPFSKQLTPVLSDLAPMLGCLRPYAPEIAGTASNWASYAQNFDGYSHYARIRLLGGPSSYDEMPEQMTSKDFTKLTGIRYAMPRPPGLNAGQPWFNADCGVGPDSVDPSKDPEDKK